MELLSLISMVLSGVAIVVSLAAFVRAGKSGRSVPAKSGRTGTSHARVLADAGRAELSVALVKHPSVTECGSVSQDFRIWVTNEGHVPAYNVNLRLDLKDPVLFKKECDEKLPFPELGPGKSFELCTRISLSTPKKFIATVLWQNPNGTQETDSYQLDRTATDN